ncbi:hypothetical protein Hrd1104_00210 [Halorhabdus sp. CBA1104]|uniref:hypothetical protein n=1 Tax=Halorhabdus sp. CBA1104 TaxID=1380432 RepID=UPI0012B1B6DC|nr:hypothetical protein [Halorhabdus sp. CBA1104]QGN05866.1 hypothetical protein Hrd1104_00210 [Halorhabdus sp. CBA1104]
MSCTVEQRERVQAAADAIEAHPRCAGVDALAPGVGPHDAWTLECTLATSTCPPDVLYALVIARLRLREARPRGTGYHVVAGV